MKTTTLAQIEHIIENLDFEGQDRLILKGGKMRYQFSPSKDGEYNELLEGLSNVIYSEFYCASEDRDLPPESYEARVDFVSQLRAANATTSKLQPAWMIDNVSQNGKVYASKGNYSQQVNPGDYIRSNRSEAVAAKSEISLYQHHEYDHPTEVFFYIFGATKTEAATPGLVRFYFNAQPAGSVALVKHLSHHFNLYQIPFQFKCLNQPALYNRTDAAVLYISKNYADFAWECMARFYPSIQELLYPSLPYFTKLLAPGIGFAENPNGEKESFGQSRSKLIAEAIVQSHAQQKPKPEWKAAILENIKKKGLDPKQFHLNANSHYPYHFAQFA